MNARPTREVLSPDRRLAARYYVVSGGGAAGYVQEIVDIRALSDSTPFDANDAVLMMSRGGGVTMKWETPERLVIEYPAWAGVSRGCHAARGVTIRYVPRATPDSAWGDDAQILLQDSRQMEQDLARRGEPAMRTRYPGLVGTCS